MADTIATSTLTPKANTDGKIVPVLQFKITDIPDAMRKMNWPVAAALMDHWFEGRPWDDESKGMPANVKIHHLDVPSQYIERTIIKMDWVLKFKRATEKFKILLAAWDSVPGRTNMLRVFDKHYADVSTATVTLDFQGQAELAAKFEYFNSQDVQYDLLDFEVDELRAALADFTMKVIAEGIIEITPESYTLHPSRLGFYLDDTYDFIDDPYYPSQVLGCWNFNGIATSAVDVVINEAGTSYEMYALAKQSVYIKSDVFEKKYIDIMAERYFFAQNKSFQEYRSKFGKGGDFKIYSDMHFENISVLPIVLRRNHAQ